MLRTMTAPFGSWKSPITSDIVVSEATPIGATALDGEDVYWIETRPKEKGRTVVVRHRRDDRTYDITPLGFDAHSRIRIRRTALHG